MGGMKRVGKRPNTTVWINHYRVGSHTHKYGTPKVLHQIGKNAAFMSAVQTALGFKTHVNQIIHDRQKNISTRYPPTYFGRLAGHSRPHTSSQKSTTAFPATERAGTMSSIPCQTQNFICTRASQPRHDVGRCTRALKPSDVFATVVRIKGAHYPHVPSNISE